MKSSIAKQMIIIAWMGFVFTLLGCASIVSKGKYPVHIDSSPSGAHITITDQDGVMQYTGTTPVNLKIKASSGYFKKANYMLTFEMDGYETKTIPIKFSLDGWYVGNLLFGGLVGILIVDPITGAMWKLNTDQINEKLTKETETVEKPAIEVYGYQHIPEDWKDNLIRIN
ncbi:PEGA domain-containing protein [Pustulibacterium marinum]|uniref:PEGA domain-containing protein n=1 Tax=Pustulibacterium marinum TaxID=1224947 RepID=A0A1I7GAL4_9FLAO|nr:PEGA domain-containing protein [Pustulibacterium marinum]SFU45490.1 PEGA domain-containing protein [Pustulibacterium marinum]